MQTVTSVARRYAEAYFELAQQAGDIDGWSKELAAVVEALGRDEVISALSNPRLSRQERTKVALDLINGVAEPARNLGRLMVERGRVALFPQVLEHYGRLAERASGVIRAEVISAVEPDDRLKDEIARTLAERLGSTVETEIHPDPSIIGGLVIRIGDRVIDDSVRTHLQQLQAAIA